VGLVSLKVNVVAIISQVAAKCHGIPGRHPRLGGLRVIGSPSLSPASWSETVFAAAMARGRASVADGNREELSLISTRSLVF
jgi:hypothetical protein